MNLKSLIILLIFIFCTSLFASDEDRSEIKTLETSLMNSIVSGDTDCAKEYAKTLLTLMSEPDLYPEIEYTIDKELRPFDSCEQADDELTLWFSHTYPNLFEKLINSTGVSIKSFKIEFLNAVSKAKFERMKSICPVAYDKKFDNQKTITDHLKYLRQVLIIGKNNGYSDYGIYNLSKVYLSLGLIEGVWEDLNSLFPYKYKYFNNI
ncbi:MAG: hypothetical protein NTY22_07550, partial [Proteobacteria bacterium]|nr:hypothetical protein [Pseudomonadota bacterium]